MKNLINLCLGCLLLFGVGASASAQDKLSDLTLITENFPPYNYIKDGRVTGVAVDVLMAAAEEMGEPLIEGSIHLQPWARGYAQALSGPEVVLFSMTRTPARETLFKWAGPVSNTKIVLIARKDSHIRISDLQDLTKYRIGAIREDIGEQLTVSLGVPLASIHRAANADSLTRLLAIGRIDLWAYDELTARWFIQQNGLNNEDFEAVYLLKEGKMYIAFSKDVHDTLVRKVQTGIDRLKAPTGQGRSRFDDIVYGYFQ